MVGEAIASDKAIMHMVLIQAPLYVSFIFPPDKNFFFYRCLR
jgi:hypothetical protein